MVRPSIKNISPAGYIISNFSNFVPAEHNSAYIVEAILQGRAKSPTGGESPRIRQLADRSGATPGPTVKVWMEEEFLKCSFY